MISYSRRGDDNGENNTADVRVQIITCYANNCRLIKVYANGQSADQCDYIAIYSGIGNTVGYSPISGGYYLRAPVFRLVLPATLLGPYNTS